MEARAINRARLNVWLTAGLLWLVAMILFDCSQKRDEAKQNPVVSPVPIQEGKPPAPVAQLPRVEVSNGEGDCAPRFPNGMRGTCIDNKPCNGFGFKAASGRIQCACFDKVGGCPENQICSLLRRACVPISDADRNSP